MSDISYLQAVVIGAMQGVTELFPVSSLGHSVLVPAWVGGSWAHLVTEQSTSTSETSPYLNFIIAVHVATALALLVFYASTWGRLIRAFVSSVRTRSITTPSQRLIWLVIIATVPVGVLGLALEHPLRVLFAKPLAAAIFLAINGLVLLLAERLRRRAPARGDQGPRDDAAGHDIDDAVTATVSQRDAVAVGFAQSLALLAGISRSGITMVAGLARGLSHEAAADFAFLLATPVILAAGLLKLPALAQPTAAGVRGPILAGAVVAFVAALFAVRFLTRFFERRSLVPFGAYCLLAGVVSIVRFA